MKHLSFLKNDEIDRQRWDWCIKNSLNGRIYGLSWYLDNVSGDWDGLVSGNYQSVMPLPRTKKAGINMALQPYFAQQLGIFSQHDLSPGEVSQFLDSIPSEFKYVDLQLNSGNSKGSTDKFEWSKRTNLTLSLEKDYESLRKNFNDNTKRNIKKAEKNDLRCYPDLGPEQLTGLYHNMSNKKTLGIREKDIHTLHRLMYQGVHKGLGEVWGVYGSHNTLIAGAFFLKFQNRITYLFPVTGAGGRESGAMPYLLDNQVRRYARSGKVLDFEGSLIPSVARFYKGFGATGEEYYRIRGNFLGFPLKQILEGYRRI